MADCISDRMRQGAPRHEGLARPGLFGKKSRRPFGGGKHPARSRVEYRSRMADVDVAPIPIFAAALILSAGRNAQWSSPMAQPIRLAVLISGGGTTLQNLLDRITRGQLDARVVA